MVKVGCVLEKKLQYLLKFADIFSHYLYATAHDTYVTFLSL